MLGVLPNVESEVRLLELEDELEELEELEDELEELEELDEELEELDDELWRPCFPFFFP